MPVSDSCSDPTGPDAPLLASAKAAFLGEQPARVAVAVSGGSDSLAALHLMAQLARQDTWDLCAVTVDHALRDGSAAEAAGVAQHCAAMGLPHQILTWQHGQIDGNLMDAARRARYGLIAQWAQGQGVSHVVLGHTADDQAETFLMGLARGAGVAGLCGMRPRWVAEGVTFLRPFLSQTRAALRDHLRRQGVGWVDDPSNANERFSRIRARKALTKLQPLGITVGTLNRVIGNLQQAQDCLQLGLEDAAARVCRMDAGEMYFDSGEWRATAPELRRQLLIAVLRWISGADYAPRASAVQRALLAIGAGRDTTLAGCSIRRAAGGFRVVREPKAVAALTCPPDQLWDGRWRLTGPAQPGQMIRCLGAEGLRQCKDWRNTGHSRDALVVSPAIWYRDHLIAAPLAGFGADWNARIDAAFSLFTVSH